MLSNVANTLYIDSAMGRASFCRMYQRNTLYLVNSGKSQVIAYPQVIAANTIYVNEM